MNLSSIMEGDDEAVRIMRFTDLHRWWYWLWINRGIRVLREEFFGIKGFGEAKHYDSVLRPLQRHERFWRSHCYNCRRWLVSSNGLCAEPDDKAISVLGYLRYRPGGTDRLLCCGCARLYREGQQEKSHASQP